MAEFNIESADKHVVVSVSVATITTDLVQTMSAAYTSLYDDNNMVLILSGVNEIEPPAVIELERWFQHVKNGDQSFVIADLKDDLGHLLPNIEQAPTITEAQDLIFMEEVERELGVHLDLDEDE